MGADGELPAGRARALGLLSSPVGRRSSAKLAALLTPAAAVLAGVAPALAAAPAATAWSQPASLDACPGAGPAQAVFPKNSPTHATGRGAVVWGAARSCAGDRGALVAEVGGGDVPAHGASPLAPPAGDLALRSPLAAIGGPHGQIVIAGSTPGAAASTGLVTQGLARGPFSPLGRTAAPASPGALATGYLGDAALASPVSSAGGSTGIEVRIERYFAHAFGAPTTVPAAAAGSVQALSIAIDYRTDAIAAWRQGGAVYARDLPASGAAHATQRLGPASVKPSISALISDDNRAIVAWAEQRGTQTSVYLDTSATGVRFGAAHLLESFTDPTGAPAPTSSPRLVRLSSESVMLAWTGAQSGHWVVRTAAIDLTGLRGVSTISPAGGDSLLADLEPGPDGEALALWGAPQRMSQGGLDLSRQAIYAARGIDAAPGKTIFAKPEQVAPAQANSDATVAFDPATDRALALWRGPGGGLEYAIRAPSAP